GGRRDDALIDESIDQLRAEAVDVHRVPRDEMPNGLLALGRANQAAHATSDSLVFQPHDFGATHGATLRERHGTRIRRPPLEHDLRNGRDDVARSAHDDGVADPDVLPEHVVDVVEGSVADGYAADEYGLETRNRCKGAG